jgi:hypothetical protein
MTATMTPMPAFAWDVPAAPASAPSGEREERPVSLQDLLDALQAFRQGPDYQRVQEAHLLVQALMQQVEVAIRETPLPAQAS